MADFIALSRRPGYIVVLVGLKPQQVAQLKGEAYHDCNLVPIARTQNQQELAQLYSLADIFVNLTYADMFPSVNLEALACGTAVVTYRTGGSPEAVDSETGCVVETGDLAGVVEAIEHLRRHPLSSEACRRRAEALFNKDVCFERYIALYNRLLHPPHAKPQ